MPEGLEPTHLLLLHQQLLTGDRTASEEILSLILGPLIHNVTRAFPRTDEHIVWDGVTDAVLEYCARPHQFDERRGVPLDRFLHRAAWRNVANAVRGEKRRKTREEKAGQEYVESSVELDPVVGNLLQQEERAQYQQQQAELMSGLQNPKDQQLLALRLQGERRTEVFAQILEISHLPIDGQRRAVKQAKDRIDKILLRRRSRS